VTKETCHFKLKGISEFLPSLKFLHWMRRVCYHGSGLADKFFGLLSRYLFGTNNEITTAGELSREVRNAIKIARGSHFICGFIFFICGTDMRVLQLLR
jgi:hypothetical protein